jgi:hypothetical protein
VEPAAANISEISLEIWRAEIDDMNGKHGKPPEAEKKVHEREKKATTHRVKYASLAASELKIRMVDSCVSPVVD